MRYEYRHCHAISSGRDSALINLRTPRRRRDLYENPTATSRRGSSFAWDPFADGRSSCARRLRAVLKHQLPRTYRDLDNPPATPRSASANPTFPTRPRARSRNTIPRSGTTSKPADHTCGTEPSAGIQRAYRSCSGTPIAGPEPLAQRRCQRPPLLSCATTTPVLRRGRPASEPQLRHHRAEDQRRRFLDYALLFEVRVRRRAPRLPVVVQRSRATSTRTQRRPSSPTHTTAPPLSPSSRLRLQQGSPDYHAKHNWVSRDVGRPRVRPREWSRASPSALCRCR